MTLKALQRFYVSSIKVARRLKLETSYGDTYLIIAKDDNYIWQRIEISRGEWSTKKQKHLPIIRRVGEVSVKKKADFQFKPDKFQKKPLPTFISGEVGQHQGERLTIYPPRKTAEGK